MTDIEKGNIYIVDFDSPLGTRLSDLVERRCNADRASYDYAMGFIRNYVPADRIDDDPSPYVITLSPDSEAGGLLAISIRDEFIVGADIDRRVYFVGPDRLHDGYTVIYPRMTVESHYIRYGKAVALLKDDRPDWDFLAPSKDDAAHGRKIASFMYCDVEKRMTPADKAALCEKSGRKPNMSIRLARGLKYCVNMADDPEAEPDMLPFSDPAFADARRVFTEWRSLPDVPFGTLILLLGLDLPLQVSDNGVSRGTTHRDLFNLSYCKYLIDSDNHRYLIHTGLVSQNSDMKLSDSTDLYSKFDNI